MEGGILRPGLGKKITRPCAMVEVLRDDLYGLPLFRRQNEHITEEVEDDRSTASGLSSISEKSSLTETSEFRSEPECTDCRRPLNGIESMPNCAACKIL